MNASNLSKTANEDMAFEYLRNEVIDAHLAGDGMRVLHICAIAIEQLAKARRKNGSALSLYQFRWVFFLGLYWMVDEWLTYQIKSLFAAAAPGSDSEWDKHLIDFLVFTFHIPVNFDSTDKLLQAPESWLRSRSSRPEDIAAFSLAIEISWYGDMNGDKWRTLADNWISKLEPSELKTSLDRLKKRLTIQSEFYNIGKLSGEEVPQGVSTGRQKRLLKGWRFFYKADFKALDAELKDLALESSVETPDYSAWYWLSHFSRMHRNSQENQFTSMSRRQYVESRSPAQACRIIREERLESSYSRLASKGFSESGATERFNCFRMVLQNQLHALRSWDIGAWILGERQRARALLELSGQGEQKFTIDGILALRNSLGIPNKAGKDVSFDKAVGMLDAVPEVERRHLVVELMRSPRVAWRDAHRVFELISDAMPGDLLHELAAWYVTLDSDEFHGRWTRTWLDGWGVLLENADDAANLIEILRAPLLKKAGDYRCWGDLHDTLYEAITKGEKSLALELLKILVAAPCPQLHFEEVRFSILYNVGRLRPDYAPVARQCLIDYIERHPDPYKEFIMRNADSQPIQSIDDPIFRDSVREQLESECRRWLREKVGSVTLGVKRFHSMILKLVWPEREPELELLLIEVVDTDYVPYINKSEAIACLAMLALRCPVDEQATIASATTRWLQTGIQGRDLGHHGPLSTGRANGFGADAIDDAFATLTEVISDRYFKVAGQEICRWVITQGVRRSSDVAEHTISTALYCSIGMSALDPGMANALVAIADGIANAVQSKHPEKAVTGFADVVFWDPPPDLADWLRTQAGRLCLDLWEQRLIEISQTASPTARKSAALTIRRWQESGIQFPESLRDVLLRLQIDCRLRVRKAARLKSQVG